MSRDDEILAKLEDALAAPEPQRIYALYVNRTAVLLLAARSLVEARSISKESWLLDDLRAAKLSGQPVLGASDKVWIARANREQEQIYRATFSQPPGDELGLVYLLPLEGISISGDAA